MSRGSIVLLAQAGDSTTIVYNALARSFDVSLVVLESPVPRRELLARRLRRLGAGTVIGQLAFRALVLPPLKINARQRIEEICATHGMSRSPIPPDIVREVSSANSEETHRLLRESAPSVVVVNGTRLLSAQTLSCVACPFINTHVGITPRYRGVHGGYWALAHGDAEHCGVTVHLVDSGIDTGGILGQATIAPSRTDNFVTYPYLQYAAALPLLESSVAAFLAGAPPPQMPAEGASKLWSSPTLREYVRGLLLTGTR